MQGLDKGLYFQTHCLMASAMLHRAGIYGAISPGVRSVLLSQQGLRRGSSSRTMMHTQVPGCLLWERHKGWKFRARFGRSLAAELQTGIRSCIGYLYCGAATGYNCGSDSRENSASVANGRI